MTKIFDGKIDGKVIVGVETHHPNESNSHSNFNVWFSNGEKTTVFQAIEDENGEYFGEYFPKEKGKIKLKLI